MDQHQHDHATQKDHEEKKEDGNKKNTGMAIIAYIVFFIPLLTDAKNDPFVKYHVKQGLVLFIAWAALSIIMSVFSVLWLISPILYIGLLVLLVIGVMNASSGKYAPLPLIGEFAKHFNF